jgi:hypothetical protein
MNRITGEKKVIINGQGYVMRFTWRALAEIEAEYGDNPNLFSPDVLSRVAAAGLRDQHPDMTPEKIMDLSPPLMPFCAAVKEAIQWAYFGAEQIPQTGTGDVKKNRLADMLSRLIKRLSRRG